MKWLAIIFLQLALLLNPALSEIPSELNNAKHDGFADNEVVPEEDMLVNPESDERAWNDEDDKNDDGIFNNDFSSYISNSNNGVSSSSYSSSSSSSNGQTIVNGIDTSKLPPNYHKVTNKTKIINGRPVTVYITIDKKTDPVTGKVSVSVTETSSSSSSSTSTSFNKADVCGLSNQCQAGYFCKSSWIKSCQKCRNINQRCSQNEECCGIETAGALCVNGICQVGFHKGDAGTLCQKTTDCASSMCCARGFMKRRGICKPLAKQGEKCATSSSSMNRMLKPGTCPCARGLLCSSGSLTERFFGGSMNTFFGGNTCRVPRRTSRKPRRGWWARIRRNVG